MYMLTDGLFFGTADIAAIRRRVAEREWARRGLERILNGLEARRGELLAGDGKAALGERPGRTLLELGLCATVRESWHREAAERLLGGLEDPAPFMFKEALELCLGLDFLAGLDDALRARAVERILIPVADKFMQARLGGGNIQTTYDLTLLCIGLLTGRKDYLERALTDPERGFAYQLANSVDADGFWHEQSHASYHSGSIERLVKMRWLALRHGLPLGGDEIVRKMLDTLPGMALPGGVLPLIGEVAGDAKPTLCKDWLELAYALYPIPWIGWALGRMDRQGLWSVLAGRDIGPAERPDCGSRRYDAAGLCVLKHGRPETWWEGRGAGATITYGPHGEWHGHAGKLGIEYRVDERYLIRDHGHGGGYAHPIHRMWYMTTLAHSTVVLDERNQKFNWSKGRPEKGRLETGTCHASLFRDEVSACTVSAGFAYPGCTVKRTLFLTGAYLLDVTECDSQDGAEHTFDWVLHTGGTLQSALPFGNGSLPCVNKGPPILTAPGQEYAPGSLWPSSYDYIREVEAAATADDWSVDVMDCKWAADVWKITGKAMRVSMLGAAGTTVFKGVCPATPADIWNPVILVRRRAVRTVFAALHVPGDRAITFSRLADAGGALAFRVREEGGPTDVLLKQDADQPVQVEGRSFSGKLAFQRHS